MSRHRARTRLTLWVAVALAPLLASVASAQAVRYVRLTGDDSNDGTSPAQAWRTINTATTNATPGMTVYFGAGTYDDFPFTTKADATAAQPIVFIADTDGVETGDAGDVVLTHPSLAMQIKHDHWTIQGFIVDGQLHDNTVLVEGCDGIVLDRCEFRNAKSDKSVLVVKSNGSVTATRCRLSTGLHAIHVRSGSAFVYASIIENTSGDAFLIEQSHCTATIANCTFHNVDDDAFDLEDGATTIYNTIVVDVVDDGIARRNSATVTHTNNLFYDVRGDVMNGTTLHASEIEADPLFESGGYELGAGSPAIDAGMDASAFYSFDFAGNARPAGGGWDIGAYENGAGAVATPPIAHWRLNEVVGPSAPDASASARHATLTNGASWTPSGWYGTGLNVSGGIAAVPDHADFQFGAGDSYSLACWVYVPALGTGTTRGVVTKATGATRGWGVWLDAADRWFAGGATTLMGPVATTGWTHVAVVQDGGTGVRTLYINGVDSGSDSAVAADAAGPIWFGGASGASEAFAGVIDDVRVWDRAISAAEADAFANPATYYVRTSGSNGSSGTTPAGAWRTIDHAIDTAPAGSIIYVGGGTYAEAVSTNHTATEDMPTVVIADTTGAHTGDSGLVTITGAASTSTITFSTASHVHFRGMTIVATSGEDGAHFALGTTWCGLFECDVQDGAATSDDGIDNDGSSSSIIAGCVFTGFDGEGLACESGSTKALDTEITGGTVGSWVRSGASLVANGLYIHGGSSSYGMRVDGAASVYNSIVADNTGFGVQVSNSSASLTAWHITVTGNSSDQIRVMSGYLALRNSIVESDGGDTLDRSGGLASEAYNIFWDGTDHGLSGVTLNSDSLAEDPLLDSAFKLADTSAAIDAGDSAAAYLVADRAGASRQQGVAPDLGAYEGGGGEIPLFVNVTAAKGFGVTTTSSHDWHSGWHWGDVDDDGDLDAIVTGDSGASLVRNVGEGASFAISAFFGGNVSRGGALADFDNDGDLDFYHTRGERLYTNDGAGGFTDAGASGFTAASNTEGAAAIDLDRDGWVDVALPAENGNWILRNAGASPVAFAGSADSDDGFHVSGSYGNGDYISTVDVNGDGHTDLLYHYNGGQLFYGDGAGGFTLGSLGVTLYTGNDDKFGSAWGDYDGDGDMDLFACRRASGERGYLLRNNGGSFTDVTVAAGVDIDTQQTSVAWGDCDNDGDLDLYISCRSDDTSQLFRNNGDGTFDAVDLGAALDADVQDVSFVDYDNDGDLDLSLALRFSDTRLLENKTDNTNYLKVRVIGAGEGKTNTSGIGARVQLLASDGVTVLGVRDVGGARGMAGGAPLWLHFGGVDPASTYVVRVTFISGVVDTTVVPASTQSVIGATTIPQMLTVQESVTGGYRVTTWNEVEPGSP